MTHPTTYQYDCMGQTVKTIYTHGGTVIACYGVRDGKLIECTIMIY